MIGGRLYKQLLQWDLENHCHFYRTVHWENMSAPPQSNHKKKPSKNEETGKSKWEVLTEMVGEEYDPAIGKNLLLHLRENNLRPIIASYNTKGGVLKSTTTCEMAHAMAELGFNVLMVDLDSQCSLTKACFRFELPQNDISVNSRLIYEGSHLPSLAENGEPIYYSIHDGLTMVSRPNDEDASNKQVRPLVVKPGGAPALVEAGFSEQQAFINSTRPSHIGSVHLIAGHHQSTDISSVIARGFETRGNTGVHRIHASVMFIINRALQDVEGDICFVDLNPDASELNRTVLMQSDYIVLPTWPDMDGVESVVDIQCRLMERLSGLKADFPVERDGGVSRASLRQNSKGWIQTQLELHYLTSHSCQDHLKLKKKFPKFIGMIMNSKEQYRDISNDQICLRDTIIKRYQDLTSRLNCTHPEQRAMVIDERGLLHFLNDLPGGNHIMALNHPHAVHNHGGIFNLQHLKTLSKQRYKPVSLLDCNDFAPQDRGRYLLNVVEIRHRIFGIVRSILHNISLDLIDEPILKVEGHNGDNHEHQDVEEGDLASVLGRRRLDMI
jgi:cellulose biosynthesis protein BcsQ